MRTLLNIGLLVSGLLVALATVSATRVAGGGLGVIQFPIIALVLGVFFLKEDSLAALALGVGLGLDTISSYPFFTWTVIVGGTVFVGWWVAKNVLTNRALPSLIMLAIAMRITYFILEIVISRASQLAGGTVWYHLGLANWRNVALAFVIEMSLLVVFFAVHIRVRGERSRMLTHI